MKIGTFCILVSALLAASPMLAHAQAVTSCDQSAMAENIVEPWEQNIATYASGAIRVARLDTVEPAAAAVHLLVLSPPEDETGSRQCRVVSMGQDGSGFFNLEFAERTAGYDPAKGVTLTIPAARFNPDTGGGLPATLHVTINQRSGDITATLTK